MVSNDPQLADGLDQPLDRRLLTGLRRRETFYVDHSSEALPTVAQLGIRRCLAAWRMSAAQTADAGHLHFFLCTGRTEYVMSIRPENTDVYCGASVNIPFDMGLISGGQYFRLRSCGDNSAPWCRCFSDFAFEPRSFSIPVEEYRPGQCVQSSQGLMWCVKRYSDNEIVLQGCESDEYIYRRDEMRHERYTDQHPE